MRTQDRLRAQFEQAYSVIEQVIDDRSQDSQRRSQTEERPRSGPSYDLAAFREYARAVYAATDDYLANVSDEALETEIPTAGDTMSVAGWVGATGLWHVMSPQGEIAALKVAPGLKGLLF